MQLLTSQNEYNRGLALKYQGLTAEETMLLKFTAVVGVHANIQILITYLSRWRKRLGSS